MTRPLLITPLGLSAAVGAVLALSLGWWLGWVEFLAVGVGFVVSLLLAVPWVLGGGRLELTRVIEPERVAAGGSARSVLTARNPGRAPSAPRTIADRVGGEEHLIDLPGIAPNGSASVALPLPTARRGVVAVGPAVLTKADPLGLLRRDLGRSATAELLVHPRVVALPPLRSGLVKDLEGPTFDNSPAGDVAFHAIRAYSEGDDVRRIHWLSTARTGTLMVRHHVDNRRPHLGVLVDDDPGAVSPEVFERCLEAAASQAVSAAADGRPLTLWVGDEEIATARRPADRTLALDRLCRCNLGPAGSTDQIVDRARRLLAVDPQVSALLFLTGGRGAADLLPLASEVRRHGPVVVARFVTSGEPPVAVPRTRVLDCADLDRFAAAWALVVR